jgi:hypothetical protein
MRMKIHMNWGTGIALAYAAFATATLTFVAFAVRRPVDLVAADYYAQSLRQDQQIDAVRNARGLGGAASIVQSGARAAVVSIPAAHAASARGTVTLYRASDASADRVVDLRTDAAGGQRISLDGLPPGVWSVRVRWSAAGRDFYLEERVFAR